LSHIGVAEKDTQGILNILL